MTPELEALLILLPHDPDWTVVLCPNGDKVQEARRLLSAMLPPQARMAGRTAVFKDGRRISIVSVDDVCFLPDGTSFSLALLGWVSKDSQAGIIKWQTKSKGFLKTM